jgi:hypothetical protein
MENYSEKCKNNLLKYSFEKNDYEVALKEWYFNDEVIDNNDYSENDGSGPSCELCEHEDLRWQFIIYNVNNKNRLKVGSSCIKQFNIALLKNNGVKISGKDRNSAVNKLITLQRINSSNKITFQVMSELCKVNRNIEQNKKFIDCWTQLKVNGTLEPNSGLYLINNFIEYNIDYGDIDLKINSHKKYTEQIKRMPKKSYALIRPFINSKKREQLDRYFE